MDFSLTSGQQTFKETARKFAEIEIAPRVDEVERGRRTPRDLIKKMRHLNFYGIQYPRIYGGVGRSFVEYCSVLEELSKIYCLVGGHIAVNTLCAGTIYEFGTEEQKGKYLPQLISGEALGSFAFTEPDTGSDPKMIRTMALRDGDECVINGHKNFVTNATLPGYIVVFCKYVEMDNQITDIIVSKNRKGYFYWKTVSKIGNAWHGSR